MPKMPFASCPSSPDGDWAQGVEPKAAQPHPRRRLDRTTQERPQVATGVAQSLALHFPLWSTPLCSRFPAPLYPRRSRSNTNSSPRSAAAQSSGRRKWRFAPFCFLLLEAHAPVFSIFSQRNPSKPRVELRFPDTPYCAKAVALSLPHSPSTPDHGFQKYVLELRTFQPTVNVRWGFGPRCARTKTTASASTPQAGSPLRLSHIQSVGWKKTPSPSPRTHSPD